MIEGKLRLKSLTRAIEEQTSPKAIGGGMGQRNSNLKTVYLSSPKGGVDGAPIKISLRIDKNEYEEHTTPTPHTFMGNLTFPERPSTT